MHDQEQDQEQSHHRQYYQHIHQIRSTHQGSNQPNRSQAIKTLLSVSSNNINTEQPADLLASPKSDSSSSASANAHLNSMGGSSSSKSICNQKKQLSKKLSALFQSNSQSYHTDDMGGRATTSTTSATQLEVKSEAFDSQFDGYSSSNEQPDSSPIEKYDKFSADENQEEDNDDAIVNQGKFVN